MKHLSWQRKSERWEQVDPYFKRLVREYDLPDGKPKTAYLTDPGQFVVGLAITEDYEHTILVKEFRPGPEKIFIDLPCGSMHDNEDPCEAMLREFEEETGYTGKPELVNICHSSPYSTQLRYTCLIKNCVPTEVGQKLDKDEFIEVVKMPLVEFVNDFLRAGKTINSAAAFFALEKLGVVDHRVKI
jgi:ADP-ribose pyrophosphatase